MEHWELVEEMPHVEQMNTQDRLLLARKRRAHQLKLHQQKEREWQRKAADHHRKTDKPHIRFDDSVVLVEAAARNDLDEVHRLLSRGVNPDSCNEDGLTALHQCCIDNNEAMLQALLDYGANVNAKDSERWTPLHAAATCGHFSLVQALIAKGADLLAVNADGNMPYDICEDENTLDYIESEMAQKGITQKIIDETRGETERSMLADIQKFAAMGKDLNAPDHQGATPLHIAAANGYVSVVEFLLEKQVNTEVRDRDDWRPTHAAACWGHLEVLELLVQAGADLNARNKHEETPADICEDQDFRERILELRCEQENRRQAEAQKRRVRRSQSNTRAQSVRRTSLRDKTLTAKKDAAEEKKLRMQAQETFKPSDQSGGALDLVPSGQVEPLQDRHEPEGEDNQQAQESVYLADSNGKLNVTVFVTINGTLADLKKQRAQIRSNGGDLSESFPTSVMGSPTLEEEPDTVVQPQPPSLPRYSGLTDVMAVEEKRRRCCVIQ